MLRPTLASLRSSSLPSSVGICNADISEIAFIVNEAQERLITDPLAPDTGWWGGWARMAFNVTPVNRSAYIVTPHNIARLIAIDVCKQPMRIRNGFYEFLEFGSGLKPKACGTTCHNTDSESQAYERDSVVTLSELHGASQTIRFYPTDGSDVGKRVLLQGVDKNGMNVLSTDNITHQSVLGENIYLNLPFVDSVNQYSVITGISKEQTAGPVHIFDVDSTTLSQSSLSSMEPGETTSSYRRYLLDGLTCHCCDSTSSQIQVTAQAKLDFVPVQSDPDYLTIQSVPALIEEVQAIRYGRMDSDLAAKLEAKHHARALALLFGQLDHYLGKVNTAISVPIFGSDRLHPQPI